MSDNMNYSILYKSIDYHKNNNDSKNIFEVITECDRISKEIESSRLLKTLKGNKKYK